ncbi:hypothetical protein EOL70_06455 [Leucothrix sargassi]|nr:hypothetical protein EOL70_06455 [Leucothrix sargassi]
MRLVKANKASDWATASNLLSRVIDRLDYLKKPLWVKEQVSIDALQQSYQLEELYFLLDEGSVGLVFLQESDPEFWPEITEHDSLYVHKLVIDPLRTGEQLGQQALDVIVLEAQKRGFNWVRLDCDDRPELHLFYQSNGFKMIDIKQVGEFTVARYQRAI